MLRYTARRLLVALPTMLAIVTAAFFLIRLAPGGPFTSDRVLAPAVEARMLAHFKLDRPLWRQYLDYVTDVARGDFGPSYQVRDFTVNELLAAGFPASVRIGLSALVLCVVAGIAAGSLAALRQNSRLDHAVMAAAMTGIAIPNFVMAPLLTLILGVQLALLPVGGWGGGSWRNLVLPVIALALPKIAYIARLTRGSLVEVLRANYIRTARAKGLPERVVLFRHAIKGALIPVVSYLGPATAAIVTGSVVIETIFDIPGIGRYFVQGALNRDYTLVLGAVVVYAGLIVALNLVVDLLYAVLDPRIRYA